MNENNPFIITYNSKENNSSFNSKIYPLLSGLNIDCYIIDTNFISEDVSNKIKSDLNLNDISSIYYHNEVAKTYKNNVDELITYISSLH
jgi:hypothetical protein